MLYKKQGTSVRRWRRETLRISQQELARIIGCARHRVSMIETGGSRPGLDLAAAIELAGGPPCSVWTRFSTSKLAELSRLADRCAQAAA